ncbi:AlkZ-related protein [Paenibacillus sp. USHLN196]|uniref:AlkZ-related protein n=1 Tax=Paenibacillus sp. USHLN196 TaxID=3081291 RepID=UPI003017652A
MTYEPVVTYEEAVQRIQSIGLLPLAPLFAEYPSLSSLTPKEHWHKDDELDPWLWRSSLAEEGIAAYGKFVKKKALLVSREYFPWVHRLLADSRSIEEQYEAGLLSREASKLYSLIEEQEGIDGRALRSQAGYGAKEDKKTFDRGLLDLQGCAAIVISGTKEKEGLAEGKVAWNSSAYETAGQWMKRHGIEPFEGSVAEARELLVTQLQQHASPVALSSIAKALGIPGI